MTSSSARNITCTIDDGVAQVWLDRPDKLNGLTLDMLGELVSGSRTLRQDRTLRAVILDRRRESFSAGLDFASALASRPHRAHLRPGAAARHQHVPGGRWGWRRLRCR